MTSTQKAVDFVSRFSFLVSRFSFLAISVFLIATPTNAQIKIKEKVEINSGNILYASSISTIHHTFTYVLSWTPEQNRRGNIRIIDCNGDTLNSGITTSGYTTISFPANGHHQFLFQEERWFYRNFYGWGWWGDIHPGRLLEVYIDDNKLNHPQNVIGHTYGLPNDFDLKFNGSICPNDYAVLSIGNVNWDNCNLPCFYDGDEAELSIIQGSEYVEFVDILSETLLGSSIHLSDYNNISNIGLKRKDDAPIVHDIQIIRVEGNINGVKDTSMIEYYPDEFVPSVDVYPETLTTGERINIDISYYSQCGPLPPETRINIEIINGAEYGNLIDPYTNERIKTITNLDHWWGYAWVEFIADGNSTKQLDTITLRITTTDQAIMPNEALLIIKPPPIYVYTVPEVLGADDTADVIIQHRLEDGTLEDFPLEQTFELAVLDGCINGNFMVGDSINVYFEDALQPIKFVTSDTLDSEVKNILIRVGTNLDEGGGGGISRPIGNLGGEEIKAVDTLRVGFEKMMAEKRAAAEKKENNEPPIEAPIVKQCALDEPTYTTYWKGFTSVGDECDEKIVVCNNYQVPKFENVSTIYVLKSGMNWQWTDSQGTIQTINSINGCNIIKPDGIGITYIMNAIGDSAISQQPSYYSLDDMKVTACADKSNSNPDDHIWRFSVENMRVPIFRDHCPSWAISNGYIDLLDGTNVDTLAKYITNCTDYSKVMEALDWWKEGPYYQTTLLPYLYYFSAGIIAHENIHVKQMKDGGTEAFSISALSKVMNGSAGLPILTKYDKFSLIVYKCPEDVLNALWGKGSEVIKLKEQIRNELRKALKIASNLKPLGGVDPQLRYNSELEADKLARPTYDKIKTNIRNWAKQQSWWCNLTIGGYFDCEGETCTP